MTMTIKNLEGFKKINHSVDGGLVTCTMYNIDTKEIKRIVVDDLEYQYGNGLISHEYTIKELEYISDLRIDEETLKQWKKDNKILYVGCKVEVIKGRKYPKGTQGIITKIYDYKDCYGRYVAEYCLTDNGMKINTANVVMI